MATLGYPEIKPCFSCHSRFLSRIVRFAEGRDPRLIQTQELVSIADQSRETLSDIKKAIASVSAVPKFSNLPEMVQNEAPHSLNYAAACNSSSP